MCREDRRCSGGDLARVLDKHGASGAKVVDHDLVVDNLVAHVDRSRVAWGAVVERQLDRANRALDTGAEAARCGEEDSERHRVPPRLSCIVLARLRRSGGGAVRTVTAAEIATTI